MKANGIQTLKFKVKHSTNDTNKLTTNYHNIRTSVRAYNKLYHHIKLRSTIQEKLISCLHLKS